MNISFINNQTDYNIVSSLPEELLKKAIDNGILQQEWLDKDYNEDLSKGIKEGKVKIYKFVYAPGVKPHWRAYYVNPGNVSTNPKLARVVSGQELLPDNHPQKHLPPVKEKPKIPSLSSFSKEELKQIQDYSKKLKPKPATQPKPKPVTTTATTTQPKPKPVTVNSTTQPKPGKVVKLATAEQIKTVSQIEEKKNLQDTFRDVKRNIYESPDDRSRAITAVRNGYNLTEKTDHLQPLKEGQPVPEWMYTNGIRIPSDYTDVLLAPSPDYEIWALCRDKNGNTQRFYNPKYREQQEEIKYNYVKDLKQQEETVYEAILNLSPEDEFEEGSNEYKTLLAAKNALLLMFHTGIRVGSSSPTNKKDTFGTLDLTIDNLHYCNFSIQNPVTGKKAKGPSKVPVLKFTGKDNVTQTIPITHPEMQGIISSIKEEIEANLKTYNSQLKQYHKDLEKFNKGKLTDEQGNPVTTAPIEPKKPDTRLFPVDYLVLMNLLRYTDMTPKDLRTMYASHLAHNIINDSSDSPIFTENSDLRDSNFSGEDVLDGKNILHQEAIQVVSPKATNPDYLGNNNLPLSIKNINKLSIKIPSTTSASKFENVTSVEEALRSIQQYDKNTKWSPELKQDLKYKAFDALVKGICTNISEKLGNKPSETLDSYVDHHIFQEWQPELYDLWVSRRNKAKQDAKNKRTQEYESFVKGKVDDPTLFLFSNSNASYKTTENYTITPTPKSNRASYAPTKHLVPYNPSNPLPEGLSDTDKEQLQSCTDIRVSPDSNKNLLAQGTLPNGTIKSFYKDSYKQSRRKYAKRMVKDTINHMDVINQAISELQKSNEFTSNSKLQESISVLQLMLHTGIHWGSKSQHGFTNMTTNDVIVNNNKVFLSIKDKKGNISQIPIKDKNLKKLLIEKKQTGGKLFNITDSQLRSLVKPFNLTLTDIRAVKATQLAREELKKYTSTNNVNDYAGIISSVCSKVGNILGISKAMVKRTYIHPSVFKEFNPFAFEQLLKVKGKKS